MQTTGPLGGGSPRPGRPRSAEVDWQAVAEGRYTKFQVSKAKVTGITSSQPKESKQAYRPPGARGTQSTFKLHDDEEPHSDLLISLQC